MREKSSRWVVPGLLMAAVAGSLWMAVPWQLVVTGRGQEQPRTADDATDEKPAEGEATDEKKPEQKDPSDVRNAIGNMSMVRGFEKLSKPVKKGLWAQLVDQPYYTDAV